ncbi:hypothetical protein [Neorhodopirellula pilleata]|uniref:hypothetical protein n=1 Tax=Neorhodopirellula pilleata TaxID=2714738 RepID=UPI0011B62CA3|nr:hypothetical protein [Neorhodopirellula pilleata]
MKLTSRLSRRRQTREIAAKGQSGEPCSLAECQTDRAVGLVEWSADPDRVAGRIGINPRYRHAGLDHYQW